MPKPETLVLTASSDDEICSSVDRLFTDLQVGSVMVKGFAQESDLNELQFRDGKNFVYDFGFMQLFGLLSKHITGSENAHRVNNTQSFVSEHGWHLPVFQQEPMIRVWLHLRDNADFSFARATGPDVDTGFSFETEEIAELAYALPTTVSPDPGDIIMFVDRGYPEVTGTSTYHKVDVPQPPYNAYINRLSVACDLTFMMSETSKSDD